MEIFSLLDFVSSTNNVTFATIHRLHIKEATFSGGCCVESLNQERVLLKLNCGMKEINTGLESRFFTPHNGGLNTADVNPDQCPSSLSGSLSNTPATDRSGTKEMPIPHIAVNREKNELKWYVVLFNKPNQELKFKRTVQADVEHTKNILEVYCPTRVVKEYHKGNNGAKAARQSNGKNAGLPYLEKPLFTGADFVYASYQGLSFYLKEYYPSGSIQLKRKSTTNMKSEPLTVPEDQMSKFMNFNDNMIDYVVKLNKPFKDYAFNKKEGLPNDTVKIVDGVLAGLTGYFTKIAGNRGMVFNVTNPYGGEPLTFAVPNIWDFHVVRLHNAESDKQTIASAKARGVDLLIGLLQSCGYDDSIIKSEFDILLDKLANGISLQKAVEDLVCQRKAILDHSLKQNNGANQKEESFNTNKKDTTTIPAQEARLQLTKCLAKRTLDITEDDRQLLFYLGSYVREFPRYVQENWRQFYLRPFLTPTSGDVIPEGNDYVIVSHSDFKEVIKRVTIGEEVYHPSNGKEEVRRSFYYAHVGIKKQKKGYILFTNWDKFLGAYFATDGMERLKLLKSLKKEDDTRKSQEAFCKYAGELYNVLKGQSLPLVATKDFSLNARTNINVLSITIPNLVLSTGEELEDSIEIKEALECLVNTGVKICKQINSSTHLAVWRDYLTTVWLHE